MNKLQLFRNTIIALLFSLLFNKIYPWINTFFPLDKKVHSNELIKNKYLFGTFAESGKHSWKLIKSFKISYEYSS